MPRYSSKAGYGIIYSHASKFVSSWFERYFPLVLVKASNETGKIGASLADCQAVEVAEREGFEPSIQVLARITV